MKRPNREQIAIFGMLIMLAVFSSCSSSHQMKSTAAAQNETKVSTDTLIGKLLSAHPQLFDSLLNDPELNIQIIYTQIDRSKKGKAQFTDYKFQVNSDRYYYPASTVKFPVAVLALQRLNELKVGGLDKNSIMITDAADSIQTAVVNDPSTSNGPPTIEHYIKKILLVSDNDAFNRLYEFLGQEYINEQLHQRGYKDVEIIHRLSIALTEEQNRKTNPVSFRDTSGQVIYEQSEKISKMVYSSRDKRLGKGYMKGDSLIKEPFDFSKKNRLPLTDLHQILKSVLFPESVSSDQRFNLSPEDYQFLYRYMSMYPRESQSPVYDTTEFKDNAAKMFVFSAENSTERKEIRIFSKAGWAYGFLTDAAYIIDPKKNLEFVVSATIYCNADGIFNDNKYDFEKIGYPFFKNLGRVLYDFELNRIKKYNPDLSSFEIIY